jgi:hypothetical protein
MPPGRKQPPQAISTGSALIPGCQIRFDATPCPVAYWLRTDLISRAMSMESHLPRSPRTNNSDGSGRPANVSLEAEVPEVLFEGMRSFISNHPHWDQYSLISSALASFLFQNGCNDHVVTKHYLDGLFLRP